MEVPDDFLLMLDQLRSNSSLMETTLSRQNQETQNGTSSTNRRCVCDKGICKCCTGYFLDLLNQKACMRVTYHPGDFAFDVAMSLNNRVLYENSLSGELSFYTVRLLIVKSTMTCLILGNGFSKKDNDT